MNGRMRNEVAPEPSAAVSLAALRQRANHLASNGQPEEAKEELLRALEFPESVVVRSELLSDLAVCEILSGREDSGRHLLREALDANPSCEAARENLAVLNAVRAVQSTVPAATAKTPVSNGNGQPRIRVAILSLLFNWPTTGGGNVHTYELSVFLERAGYDVHHFYAVYPLWNIGQVQERLPYRATALEFTETQWSLDSIKARFQQGVDSYGPDYVIITDSWNFKPWLADAVRGHAYLLRLQANELLCPLNNLRLLPDGQQCSRYQLATPSECMACLDSLGEFSGPLHRAERALSGVGTAEYDQVLRRTLREAHAVLVVNPLAEVMLGPFARQVRVVTSGFDPSRFPKRRAHGQTTGPKQLLFAGLIDEGIKGFHVALEACGELWRRRQDFELVATADPIGRFNEFTRFVGWQSQQSLPSFFEQATMLLFPTIAQEALGRTAVEAMAAGIPVVASRIGGLPYTVLDGATGLLCDPGDPYDLAGKIERLLDDPDLCDRMGAAARQRFDERYTWERIIERSYRPLLAERKALRAVGAAET